MHTESAQQVYSRLSTVLCPTSYRRRTKQPEPTSQSDSLQKIKNQVVSVSFNQDDAEPGQSKPHSSLLTDSNLQALGRTQSQSRNTTRYVATARKSVPMARFRAVNITSPMKSSPQRTTLANSSDSSTSRAISTRISPSEATCTKGTSNKLKLPAVPSCSVSSYSNVCPRAVRRKPSTGFRSSS